MILNLDWDFETVQTDIRLAGAVLGTAIPSLATLRQEYEQLKPRSIVPPSYSVIDKYAGIGNIEVEKFDKDVDIKDCGEPEVKLKAEPLPKAVELPEYISKSSVRVKVSKSIVILDNSKGDRESIVRAFLGVTEVKPIVTDVSVPSDVFPVSRGLVILGESKAGRESELRSFLGIPEVDYGYIPEIPAWQKDIAPAEFKLEPVVEVIEKETVWGSTSSKDVPINKEEKPVVKTVKSDDLPNTVIEFLRLHSGSEISLVVSHYGKSAVSKELKRGNILQKNNKLYT